MISEWNHDTYDYSQDTGVMENNVTISYETVKYYSGAVGGVRPDTNVQGFASPSYYDQQGGSLSRPGGTRSILGQGGLLDAGLGIISDLESGTVGGLIGAVQKAGTAYNTFKGANLKSIVKEEAIGAVQDVLRSTTSGAPSSTNVGREVLSPVRNILQKPIFPVPPKG
jgi:hypothetical protein